MQLTISLLTTSLVNFCRGKMFVDEQRGITIGRKEDNDLVLIDETLCVSSHHASIYCQGNQFYLADTSTNGTFLNSSSQRIEKGSSVMLREGDKITIGPYDFLVKFEKSIVSQDVNNNHGLKPNTEEKLFSGLEGLFSSNPVGFPEPGISSSQGTGSTIPSDVSNSNNSALDDDWLGEDDNNLPVSEVPNIQKKDSEIPKEPRTRISNYDTSSSDDNSQAGLENNKDGQSSQSQAITSNQDINKALYWDCFINELSEDLDCTNQDIARNLGLVMKALLEGMTELVRLRENIKNEYRLQRTQIKDKYNNPFKFSASARDLIKALSTNEDAYIIGPDAVKEVVKDITLHEAVVMAAMQKTIEMTLSKMSPENILTFTRQENTGFLSKMSIKRKCWDNYEKQYDLFISQDNDELIQRVNMIFIQIYESEIAKLNDK